MKRTLSIFLIIVLTLFFQDSAFAASYKTLPIKSGSVYVLKSNWNLKGETYQIPEGVTLKSRGGVFKNGTLVGTETRVDTCKPLFSHVMIKGTWNVPIISTKLFSDLDYVNSLVDVFALASPDIHNMIIVEKGDYRVFTKAYKGALNIGSNTDVIINGNVRLEPNDYRCCSVLLVDKAENVTLTGKGCIYGDKYTHLGTEGEWGMGINIYGSDNVTIKNFTIRNCWGDCIYVGQNSGRVKILNCKLDNGRRQGISITAASDILIKGCVISNVSGTEPEYAIDIEPNKDESVGNVKIQNCHSINCKGGFTCSTYAENSSIEDVLIENCSAEGNITKYPYLIWGLDKVSIVNCSGTKNQFYLVKVKDAYLKGNQFDGKRGKNVYKFSQSGKKKIVK